MIVLAERILQTGVAGVLLRLLSSNAVKNLGRVEVAGVCESGLVLRGKCRLPGVCRRLRAGVNLRAWHYIYLVSELLLRHDAAVLAVYAILREVGRRGGQAVLLEHDASRLVCVGMRVESGSP